jgi:hypothetical protein
MKQNWVLLCIEYKRVTRQNNKMLKCLRNVKEWEGRVDREYKAK